jgi:hypothetical protein
MAVTIKVNGLRKAIYASVWLNSFFDCESKIFSGPDVPFGVECSVIALPYGERWRVRIAWSNGSDNVDVHVSHCPTGEVLFSGSFDDWNKAVPAISEAVKGY